MSNVAAPNGNGNGTTTVESPVKADSIIVQTLTPLVPVLDQMKAKEAEMQAALEEQRSEVRKVERVLKDAGLIERSVTKPTKSSRSKVGTPGTSVRAQQAVERCRKAVKSFNGEPFQISMLEKAAGASRETVQKSLKQFNDEGWVRLLGMRPQLQRKPGAPGGRMAETHQEIID